MLGLMIKYNAVKWDNYQGGSGMPYNGTVIVKINDDVTIKQAIKIAKNQAQTLEQATFVGEVAIQEITIIQIRDSIRATIEP